MILNLEQIQNLTVGAVNIDEKEDGIHFYKMKKCQIDAFYALSDILGFRAETTTGVRLDFETDSKFLAFEIKGIAFFIDGIVKKFVIVFAVQSIAEVGDQIAPLHFGSFLCQSEIT